MAEEATQADIQQLIEARDFAALKRALREMETHDLAETLAGLDDEQLGVCFRLLPLAPAAEVFFELDTDLQGRLVTTLSSERVAELLNSMPPDDRTELLEGVPEELAERLLETLQGEELRVARSLLSYPEESVGRLMTPEYVSVRPEWTVQQVLDHLREVGGEAETLNVIYVVDERGRLLGDLYLEQLVLADPSGKVSEVYDEQVASLWVRDDREAAVELVMKYDELAIPVVTRNHVLVGIVTVDDVMDVAEEETTEDFQKVAGVAALESGYFSVSSVRMLAKRLPWLAILFVAEILTVIALEAIQADIDAKVLALMVGFVPLINACAGNTGSQMSGLTIRGLAVGEMQLSQWHRVLLGELGRGAALGTVLGAMGLVTVLVFAKPVGLAVGVLAAMVLIITFANVLGAMMPFLFQRIGVDPALTSAPFIASLMDVSAILIYFGVAIAVLSAMG